MAVYEWGRSETHGGYLGFSDLDERLLNWSDPIMGVPLAPLDSWERPRLTQYLGAGKTKRKPKPIGDAPSSGSLRLISQRAADALADVWARHALLYPVDLDDTDQQYYMAPNGDGGS